MKSSLSGEEALRHQMVGFLPRMRRFARGLARDPDKADDLIQAACERALTRLHQVREGTRLDSWLYRIIYTCWVDSFRRSVTRSSYLVALANENAATATTAESGGHLDAALDLERAFKTLPDECVAAIMLVSVEGYSYTEAAGVMNVPVGTVASRVARSRALLGRLLFRGKERALRPLESINREGRK